MLEKKSNSRVKLSAAYSTFRNLQREDLIAMGGFTIALKPKQVLHVPSGYVIVEFSLTPHSIISHWSNLLPWQSQIDGIKDDLELITDMLHTELKEVDSNMVDVEETSESLSPAYLAKFEAQLNVANVLIDMANTARWGGWGWRQVCFFSCIVMI